MRSFCFFLALIAGTPAHAADAGARTEYIGGTSERLSIGAGGSLITTHPETLRFSANRHALELPYRNINLLEYGLRSGRRVVLAVLISPLLLLSKSRQHFLTIGYVDDEGRQQSLVFRVDKSDLRGVLASLEARTGLQVRYQDEEARKAGRG